MFAPVNELIVAEAPRTTEPATICPHRRAYYDSAMPYTVAFKTDKCEKQMARCAISRFDYVEVCYGAIGVLLQLGGNSSKAKTHERGRRLVPKRLTKQSVQCLRLRTTKQLLDRFGMWQLRRQEVSHSKSRRK